MQPTLFDQPARVRMADLGSGVNGIVLEGKAAQYLFENTIGQPKEVFLEPKLEIVIKEEAKVVGPLLCVHRIQHWLIFFQNEVFQCSFSFPPGKPIQFKK